MNVIFSLNLSVMLNILKNTIKFKLGPANGCEPRLRSGGLLYCVSQ